MLEGADQSDQMIGENSPAPPSAADLGEKIKLVEPLGELVAEVTTI